MADFPAELRVRIEDAGDEIILDAPVRQNPEELAEVWDNGTRFGVYKLVEVKTLLTEVKII